MAVVGGRPRWWLWGCDAMGVMGDEEKMRWEKYGRDERGVQRDRSDERNSKLGERWE